MRYSLGLLATGALVMGLLAGCSGGPEPAPPRNPAAPPSNPAAPPRNPPSNPAAPPSNPDAATLRPVTMADAASCPVTRPGRFVPPSGESPGVLFGADAAYGNGQLWVGALWENGVIAADSRFVEADGSVGMKFGWYRVTPGPLTITGRRLDAPAPPARADVPDGYGDAGFQATGVHFPTEGCWEITGTVGRAKLTFVTFVIKV